MSIIEVDFQIIFYMIVGFFGLVGFLRGWWKEGITTIFLVFLLLLIQRPDIAIRIIDSINKVIKLIFTFFTARSLEPEALAATAATVEPPVTIDPTTFKIYLITLIALVVASYFISNNRIGNNIVTPGGRLVGAVLGIINGVIALSLIREYAIGRFLPGAQVSAAAAPPTTFALQVTNLPRSSITEGAAIWVFLIGGAILGLLVLGTRWQYTKGQLKSLTPPGYKAPPKKKKVGDALEEAILKAAER